MTKTTKTEAARKLSAMTEGMLAEDATGPSGMLAGFAAFSDRVDAFQAELDAETEGERAERLADWKAAAEDDS